MKNSRNKIAALFLLFSLAATAQVGIVTTNPQATLDVTAANLTGTTVDGLLVPRVSRLRAQTMTGTPTSTLIYIDDISNGTLAGTTINVTTVGFYFFNGTVWERLASGAANAWNTTGNSGISGTTNFLGTTNDADLAFRRNNFAAGKIGTSSTSFGVNALTAGVATNNTAFGTNALSVATGADNVAVGHNTLAANTSAIRNTAMGFQAAQSLIGGSRNTALGYSALQLNTGGNENVAIGNFALGRNTGSGNVAIGHESMFGSGSAFNNSTAIGWHALFGNSGSNNTAVGYNALQGNLTATGNTAVGSSALNNETGSNNTAVGTNAGFENQNGSNNTYVGFEAGRYNTFAANNNAFFGFQAGLFSSGSANTALGSNTLKGNFATSNNVAIGYNALTANQGSGNVAIGYNAGVAETGSNKLYITNSNTTPTTSLIYGEFSPTRILRTNSTFQIGDPAGTGYVFPAARGTANQILQTNGTGVLSWVNPSALSITETDPQVSSTTTGYVPRWNGTTLVDGIIRDDATNVGIGVAPSAGNRLDVNGNTRTTNFQMTTGAAPSYILQSDATGNGSWVANAAANLSLVRTRLSANQALTTTGWQKVNFDTEDFDTANEFAGGTFTATKAGFYRITAQLHTDNQSNGQFYGIGVYVNGALYQEASANHYGNGPAERSVTCLVQLAVGGTVEVYAQNWQTGANVDSYQTKTVFEIQQVR